MPCLLAVAVYVNALRNPFVYDDYVTVVENPSLEDLSNVGAILLFARFRPLVNVTYALDRSLWGLEPFGYHLTNLALHVINVGLLFALAAVMLADSRRKDDGGRAVGSGAHRFGTPVFVAALFAVHPLMTQAVGYTSARAELLSTTFVLMSLLLLRQWLIHGDVRWLLMGLATFVLGLASKESAVAMPFILLLYDRLLLKAEPGEWRRRLWRFYLPCIGVVAVAAGVRLWVLLTVEAPTLPREVWQNALSQAEIVWRYLALLAWPLSQSVVHPAQRVSSFLDVGVWFAVAGLVMLSALAFLIRRRAPVVSLGVAWFLLALAPSSSLVPLNELMSEHRVYLASAGAFLSASALLAKAKPLAWDGRPWRGFLFACAVGVLVTLAGLTMKRNRVWSEPVELWREATIRAPKTWASFFFLGEALRRERRCEEAVRAYRRAVQILADEPEAWIRMGVCLADGRRLQEAQASFVTALELDPHSSRAHQYLGRTLASGGDVDQARSHFASAIEADPKNVSAVLDLAMLYEHVLGDPTTAMELCRKAETLSSRAAGKARECVARNQARISAASSP